MYFTLVFPFYATTPLYLFLFIHFKASVTLQGYINRNYKSTNTLWRIIIG